MYFVMLNRAESSPRTNGPSSGEDWRNAFDAAANGPADSFGGPSRSHSRRNSDPAQNGDVNSNSSRRTPTRMPPVPPPSGSSYRY